MRSVSCFRARFSAALGFILLASPTLAQGRNGRDFAGFYDVKNATEQGSVVHFTLSLRLINHSDADVGDATLKLRDSFLHQKIYGSFQSVSVSDRGRVRLSGDFAVPRREYERWQGGAAPNLTIEFRDSAGKGIRRRVELIRTPLGEKE